MLSDSTEKIDETKYFSTKYIKKGCKPSKIYLQNCGDSNSRKSTSGLTVVHRKGKRGCNQQIQLSVLTNTGENENTQLHIMRNA